MLNLNHVMLGTNDLAPMVEFYNKVLGEPMMKMETMIGWVAGNGFLSVGTHSDITGKNTEPARAIVFYETSDVKGEFERIKGLGGKVVAEPYQPGAGDGGWLATLADPDGNYFQLATPWDAKDTK